MWIQKSVIAPDYGGDSHHNRTAETESPQVMDRQQARGRRAVDHLR